MANLDDVRRQHPITDQDAYQRAYAEADLASRLAEIVYRLRTTVSGETVHLGSTAA